MNRKPIIIWKDGGPKWVAGYTLKANNIPLAAFRDDGEHEYTFVDLRTGCMYGNTKCYTLASAMKELKEMPFHGWLPSLPEILSDPGLFEQMNEIYRFEHGGV